MKLGVSVYPEQETLEQIDAYLALASKYGFSKVFTSMFSVEGTREEIVKYLKTSVRLRIVTGWKFLVTATVSSLKEWARLKKICLFLKKWASTSFVWTLASTTKEMQY